MSDMWQGLGFLLNKEKSILRPSTSTEFLRFWVDSVATTHNLPGAKHHSIRREIRWVWGRPRNTLRHLTHIFGLLSASIQAIFPAPLHYRALLAPTGGEAHCEGLSTTVFGLHSNIGYTSMPWNCWPARLSSGVPSGTEQF